MSSSITPEASKVLRRWAGSDYYVYLRPISSKYHDPDKKEKTYWTVQVECRIIVHNEKGQPTNLKPFRGEGYDLSEVIVQLGLQVPKRSKGYVVERPGYSGWLVPQRELKRQRMVAKKAVKEEPKGRVVRRKKKRG